MGIHLLILTDDSAAGLYGQLVKLNALVEDEAYQQISFILGRNPRISCIPLTSYLTVQRKHMILFLTC